MVPRRRDAAEVIGEALRLAADGIGIARSRSVSGARKAPSVAGCEGVRTVIEERKTARA